MDKTKGVCTLVVGMAREGTSLARFLAERGARVTVTDIKPAEALADRIAALDGLPLTLALGGHPLALLDNSDLVFVSPGVPLEIPLLVEARRRELPLSSETRLFTRICPAPIVGITGSSGKTTTTALVGQMIKSAGRRTWVGGNIGQPLIGRAAEMGSSDTVVMELSSFQLEFFGPWGTGERARSGVLFDPAGWSPPIAAILNITPNHLDRHPTMEAYIAAKAHILAYQRPGDVAVLSLDNAVTRRMGESVRRLTNGIAASRSQQVLWFSMAEEVEEGGYQRGDELVLRLGGREAVVCQTGELKLKGLHNVANVLAACVLAGSAGVPVEALRQVATSFGGVEHRLELVRKWNDARWYNDSIATSPERTVAALRAFDAPIVLLAGGRDKHLPWAEMAALIRRKVRCLVLFGEAAGAIARAVQEAEGNGQDEQVQHMLEPPIHHAGTLEMAVDRAAGLARPGDIVLLSPGGTSFDAYADFVARGEHFRKLVEALE